MNRERLPSRLVRRSAGVSSKVLLVLVAASIAACSDSADSGSPGAGPGSTPGRDAGSTSPAIPADGIGEAVLAACPQSSSLRQTTEWLACLEGKRSVGTEPFTNQPCELRVGQNGAFEYLRSGTVALTVPARTAWRNASGTYQNDATSGPRFFLAQVSPDLVIVEGQPTLDALKLFFSALPGNDDTVEVKYFDKARARQTYNCTVEAL